MTSSATNPDLYEPARTLADEAGLAGHSLRPLDHGLSSDLFTVHATEQAPPEAVVKLQRGFAGKVHAEAGALEFLGTQDLPDVPRLLHAAPSHTPPGLVLSWLDAGCSPRGVELEPLSEHDLEKFGEHFGRWLAHLHSLEVPECQVKMSSDPLALPDRLLTQAENALRRFERDFGEAQPEIARLLKRALDWLEEHTSKLLDTSARHMIHRDLRPPNVLVDRADEFCGVVDFEHAAAAHPAWDFAKLDWWWFDHTPALEAPFRAGYESKRAWPDRQVRRLFRIFEATTLVAYFFDRHLIYPDQALSQLRAELAGRERPRWGLDASA